METIVCVDGLAPWMTSADLHALCARYGIVESAEVITDEAGESLEYGFVKMATVEQADDVVGGLDGLDRYGTVLYAARLSPELALAS